MDNYTFVPTAPITHSVELYTARFLVQGAISGPFKRTSDLLNQRERPFLSVEGAMVTPVGQQVEPRKLGPHMMMSKAHIHMVAAAPQEPPAPDRDQAQTQGRTQQVGGGAREFYIQKTSFLCYVLTDTFAIHGHCHIRQGTDISVLLEAGDPFIPVTNPTISLLSRPNASWRRDLVLVNKEKLEIVYLVDA